MGSGSKIPNWKKTRQESPFLLTQTPKRSWNRTKYMRINGSGKRGEFRSDTAYRTTEKHKLTAQTGDWILSGTRLYQIAFHRKIIEVDGEKVKKRKKQHENGHQKHIITHAIAKERQGRKESESHILVLNQLVYTNY